MAVPANFSCPDREKFQYCYSKLINFQYRDEESVKTDINLLLDQLNSLEYSTVIVTAVTGNNLLNKLCMTVPLHDDRLVVKFCQLANTWERKQMLHLDDQCLKVLTNYLIKAVERCQKWTTAEILAALASVVYENVDRLEEFHEHLLGKLGILVQLINNEIIDSNSLEEAVLCVECLTLKPSAGLGYLSAEYVDVCFDLFCMLLHKMPSTNVEQMLRCKIIVNCLRGIQNMVQMTKLVPRNKLGIILAALRAYMFYGLYSQPLVIADSLHPSPLVKVDLPVLGKLSEATPKKFTDKQVEPGPKKSKRKTKKKSDRQGGKLNSQVDRSHGGDHGDTNERSVSSMGVSGTSMEADLSIYTTWSKISSSESDWSDTEGGQGSRLRSICTKVRQCALSCFYWIAKMIDKKLMFSYWSCFIPDSQNSNDTQTLFTIIQKDPSPKCRMGALAALSVLVDGTKLLLTAAEDRDENKTVAFTPFSVILGSTIKEIHRCLLQAMVCEDYPITLTQLIKCFGTVIANVPYHRMRPGLLSRIVKQIKHFINHRDPNVRVACLTCLGAMAGIQPPLMEICHIVQPARPPVSAKQPIPADIDSALTQGKASRDTESGFNIPSQASRDPDSGCDNSPMVNSPRGAFQFGGTASESVENTTPKQSTASSSGIHTPVFSDPYEQSHATDISWVVKLCVKNILTQNSQDTVFGPEELHTEPIPVRLESLQVLANLTKGYFPIIRNCVPLLQELIHKCFCDKDPVVKLHAGKLLDEFSQVLLHDVAGTDSVKQVPGSVSLSQVSEFWLSLLNGPIQEILQNPNNTAVKASTCDCIANIGDAVFKMLPLDKRIMCLTVVLGLANEDDHFLRASAIRTLGVYVLYRCVREDVSFIADATSTILGSMEDKNIAVRVKAAWSLANLSDALALNREENDQEFLTDFSDVLALNVVTIATHACQDSDKVKPNGVRALGNILRFVTSKQLRKETFNQAVSSGVRALVKCVSSGAMKVRWNACYAISNMYKNTDLKQETASWNVDVLRALCTVVKECKNFKVRINAAIALSAPQERRLYGDVDTYCSVWSGVVDAFNTAEEIDEFVNFKYRDNLVDQLCVAVFHLMSILDLKDTSQLLPFLQSKGELIAYELDKYYCVRHEDSLMDKELELARTRLKYLTTPDVSSSEYTCIDILTKICFQLPEVIDIDPLTQKIPSTFVQSYD